MAVERDTLLEAGLATVAVVVFIAFLVAASLMSGDGVSETGAFLIIGGIVAFALVMAAFGLFFFGDD